MALSSRTARLAALLLIAAVALAMAPAAPSARAQDPPRVAYVYNTDTASRDSFKTELELRGFAFTAVTLAEAGADVPDPNFSQYDIIIVAHDTGDVTGGAAWLGNGIAADRIARAFRYTVGVGFGGAQYFSTPNLNLAIGFNNGVTGLSRGVQAVNPGDAAWNAPHSVPLAADGSVRLYTGEVGGRFANPPTLTNVSLIGRVLGPNGDGFLYPLAAEANPQLGNTCYLLWGHRGAPAFMTPEGRDTLENLLRDAPCDNEQGRVRADVAIVKNAPKAATVGQNLTYTMVISNGFRLAAPQVVMEDTLPANVTLVSATPSQGSCRSGPRRVVCALGDLAAGASATVTIVVRPTEVGPLLNVARVSGRFEDLDPSNNRAEAATEVGLPPSTPLLRALPYKPVIAELIYPLPTSDLSIHGIEITQGIQCFDTSAGLAGCPDNSLPQVNRKSTVARIYLRVSGAASVLNNVPVRLVLIDVNNVEYVVNTVGKALTFIDRANGSSSANVYFTVNFNGTVPVRYYAIVDPNGSIAETNEGNNRFPAAGTRSSTFSASRTMKIVGQRLRYHPSGYSGTQYAGGWAVNGGAADWLEQLLPIRNNGINYQVASGYLNWTTTLNTAGQHALIGNLNSRWIMQNVFAWLFGTGAYTGARHVYGWAPNDGYSGGHADMPVYPHAGGLGVVGIGTDRPGTSTDNPGGGALIFGHELVHDYDLKHTDTADACGSNDDTSTWPYGSSSIQEFGFNPITGKVYNPASTHDLMSYCPAGGSKQGWIAPFTWSAMFSELQAGAQNQLAQAPTADTALAVSVQVSNPALGPMQGSILEATKVDTTVPLVTPAPGPYALELRGAGGAVLSTTPFTLTFKSEYSHHEGDHPGDPAETPFASAHMVIPWQDGTTELAILHDGAQIGSQAVSALPPSVLITSPSAPATWQPGATETISWTASDPDSPSLTYSVLYSRDGEQWDLLATGLSATSYAVTVNDLAGSSEGRFRVVANDGVNIGSDETPLIAVPDQAPAASILNPGDNGSVPVGELLVLQGFGGDFEDGMLPDAALSWSSDRAGALGEGGELPVTNLAPGLHTITLTATDSSGQTATTTARLFVGERLFVPLAHR
jgi:uncharacterized repeat protein (TIGR01451 family)